MMSTATIRLFLLPLTNSISSHCLSTHSFASQLEKGLSGFISSGNSLIAILSIVTDADYLQENFRIYPKENDQNSFDFQSRLFNFSTLKGQESNRK